MEQLPVTGESVPDLSGFDRLMTEIMIKWQMPGGQLAIARNDRLVYNRGFGYASVEDQLEVEPDALFASRATPSRSPRLPSSASSTPAGSRSTRRPSRSLPSSSRVTRLAMSGLTRLRLSSCWFTRAAGTVRRGTTRSTSRGRSSRHTPATKRSPPKRAP